MTLPFPPPMGYKFLENTHKSYRIQEQFLINYTPSSKLNCTPSYFLEKLHFSATSSSLCQLPEKVGGAHQKSSPHTHTHPAGSTSAANAGATPLLPPAGTSLESRPLQGLAAPAARPATPRSPPGTEATAARGGDAQPLQSGRHSGDSPRTPAGRARSGVPGARLARSTTRWPRATFPAQGGEEGRAQRAGRSGCVQAPAGPSPGSETPAPFFPPGLRPPPSTRLREPGSPRARRTQNTRGRAARALRLELRRAGGGAHWAPGTGGARRTAHSPPPRRGCKARVSDQTSRPVNFASPAA